MKSRQKNDDIWLRRLSGVCWGFVTVYHLHPPTTLLRPASSSTN